MDENLYYKSLGPGEVQWRVHEDLGQRREQRYLCLCLFSNQCPWKTVASRLHFSRSDPAIILSRLLLVLYLLSNTQCLTNFLCLTRRDKKKASDSYYTQQPCLFRTCLYENNIDLLDSQVPFMPLTNGSYSVTSDAPLSSLPVNTGSQGLSKAVTCF